MKGIDKILWLNSNNRPDRFRNMKERFSKLGIEAERFPAIYGGAVNWGDEYHSKFYKQDIEQDLNNGELGCYLSHLAMYQMIKENGWGKTLILEDDADLHIGFVEEFEQFISKVPEYEMFYLGQWNYDKGADVGERTALKEKIYEYGNRSIYSASKCWLTHAYIVDIDVIDKLLNNTKNIYGSIDRVLADIQEKENLKVYAIYPNLVNQDFTKSSLRNI